MHSNVEKSYSHVTRLSSDMLIGDNFCRVNSTANFPDSGHLRVDTEDIYYAAKTDNTFEHLTRGLRNSLRKKHKQNGYVVFVKHYNPVEDAYHDATDWIGDDILIDANGELFVDGKGDIVIAHGMDALDVALRLRVSSVSEFGTSSIGVDFKNGTIEDINSILSSVANAVSSHPSVSRVDSINYEVVDTYRLDVSMHVYVRGLQNGFRFVYKIQNKGQF